MTRLLARAEPEKALTSEWQYNYVEFGREGLKQAAEIGVISDGALAESANVTLDFELLKSEFGVTAFVQGTLPRNFSKVRAFFTFKRGTSTQLIAFTNNSMFFFDEGASTFVPTGDMTTTVIEDFTAGEDTIYLADSIPELPDTYLVITLATGAKHTAQILEFNFQGTPNNYRIDPPLPAAVPFGNEVQRATRLNGVDTFPYVATALAGTGELYFTNNSDRPKRYNGSLVSDIQNIPFDTYRCLSICVHYARIVLLNCTEDGVAFPTRTRWCEIGAPNVWLPEKFLDLNETPDEIVTGLPLNKDIIVYKSQSIYRYEHIGQIDETWRATKLIEDEGLVSPLAVVRVVNAHAFLGFREFYLYDGGYSLTPIGRDIFDNISGPRSRIDGSARSNVISCYSPITREIWWAIEARDVIVFDNPWDDGEPFDDATGWEPEIDDFYTNLYKYKISHDAWTIRTYTSEISALVNGRFNTALTYLTANVAYNAARFTYAGGKSEQRELVLLADATENTVVSFDTRTSSNNGAPIPWAFETKLFSYDHYKIRTNRFDLHIGGGIANLWYSIDRGVTWFEIGTVPASSALRQYTLYKQIVCSTIQFRLEGVDFLELKHFGFSWRRESRHG